MVRRQKLHHHVYVIELHKDVLLEPRFRKNNPGYVDGKPCVYVGMTGLDPDLRFDKHKAGIQANAYVQKYGLRLLPDLYEGFNPMRYEDAQEREVEIGIDLRSAGFGVWQALWPTRWFGLMDTPGCSRAGISCHPAGFPTPGDVWTFQDFFSSTGRSCWWRCGLATNSGAHEG